MIGVESLVCETAGDVACFRQLERRSDIAAGRPAVGMLRWRGDRRPAAADRPDRLMDEGAGAEDHGNGRTVRAEAATAIVIGVPPKPDLQDSRTPR